MATDTITIQTTQNVAIDYDLANLGGRIGAYLIDFILIIIVYVFLVALLDAVGVDLEETAVIMIGPVTWLIGYFFLMETFNRGQTLGKKAVGLRVIRMDGRDPTPGDFLARALFMFVDVLLTSGIAASVLVATGKNKQRLGDMAAGTVVIKVKSTSMFSLQEIKSIRDRKDYEPVFPNVQQYVDEDMMVVKQTLTRLRKYHNAAHRQAARQLALRIAQQLGLKQEDLDYTPEQFLETVLMDYIVITR